MTPVINNRLLKIGCAGWSLRGEHQPYFPDGESHLNRYAYVFNAVEVNSCFYRSHRPATWARWAESTPEGFRFSYKLPKSITHQARLQNVGELLSSFLDEVAYLGSRQGTLLVQLPPSFAFEANVVSEFFLLLHRLDEARGIRRLVACEPRHSSWFTTEADRLLKELAVAGVAAHPSRPHQAFAPTGFTGHEYYRMHGAPRIYYSAYDETELQALASKLSLSVNAGIETWCIFDNTAEGYAVNNALRLVQILQPT